MREQVDFSKYPKLEKILNITKEIIPASISSIIATELEVTQVTMDKMDPKDFFESYEDQVLITVDETNSNTKLGFLFQLSGITSLADKMLGGDGDSKTELNEESKDAIKELSSQLISSLNVPYETEIESSVNMKIDNIVINNLSNIFTSIEYFVIEFTAKMDSKSLKFVLYFEHGFEQYISSDTMIDLTKKEEESFQNQQQNQHQSSMNLDLLLDIDIPLSVKMGTAKLFLKDILGLGPGNIVELEENADEPIELTVNDKVIARGEVVIVDGYFGFRIKEIISRAERIKRLRD